MTRLYSYLLLISSCFFKIFPLKKNRFYFCSFHGQYTDSPRKISEALYKQYPSAEYIWEISEKCHEMLPEYIKTVRPFSLQAIKMRSTSKIVVENYMGYYWGYTELSSLARLLFSWIKRKKQLNISTWHGTPLKKIGLDEPKYKNKNLEFYSSSDYLLCNSKFLADLFKRLTQNKIFLLMTGLPRNDLIFKATANDKRKLLEKLKLPMDKKIILFAPTFRNNNIRMSGLCQLEQLDIEKLLQSLCSKFGGEWIFVFRAHDSVLCEVEKQSIKSNFIYSGNIGDDMSDYTLVADALLTDYSGCFYDFILTRRPCFLYCPDIEHYSGEERGFYFNIEELPFPCAKTFEELIEVIDSFILEQYQSRVDDFQERIGSFDNGHGTENVITIIQKNL